MASALASADYASHLYSLTKNDERLFIYTSPLAPFLDPGSLAFEDPGRYGYRLFARSLEDHRSRLNELSWRDVLSYETIWMTRDQIVDSSYDAADRLNVVRFNAGHIDEDELKARQERSGLARGLLHDMGEARNIKDDGERSRYLVGLKVKGEDLMESTICEKRDLEWDSPGIIRSLPRALINLLITKR